MTTLCIIFPRVKEYQIIIFNQNYNESFFDPDILLFLLICIRFLIYFSAIRLLRFKRFSNNRDGPRTVSDNVFDEILLTMTTAIRRNYKSYRD